LAERDASGRCRGYSESRIMSGCAVVVAAAARPARVCVVCPGGRARLMGN
jgi:hypothetical protein